LLAFGGADLGRVRPSWSSRRSPRNSVKPTTCGLHAASSSKWKRSADAQVRRGGLPGGAAHVTFGSGPGPHTRRALLLLLVLAFLFGGPRSTAVHASTSRGCRRVRVRRTSRRRLARVGQLGRLALRAR